MGTTYGGEMARVSLPSVRPALIVGLVALLVAILALSRCSSEPEVVKKVAAPTTTAVKTPPPPAPFTAKGMPADLAAVIKPLYFGGAVRSSRSAGKVLLKRKPVKATGPVVVSGAVSTWKGVPIAVVTTGKDVTLAVKAPRWKVVGGWWPSIGVAAPSLGGTSRRVLVIGSDARKGQPAERSRADSLHIVGYDGRGGGGILGIARDSYVPLASGGSGKINAELVFGGPASLQRTVTSATGVKLDGYLVTGFGGFRKLINGMGGLPLNVPVAIKDRDAQANIKAGPRTLDGSQSLAYSRARHSVAGGDFGRSVNQGRLIKAAGGLAKLAGPSKLPGLLRNVGRNVGSNLSAEQVLTLAAGAYVTNPKKVGNKVAAGGFGMTSRGESIVIWNANARRLFADIRDGNLK
jgi:LCP family protein required for cell wall assembly